MERKEENSLLNLWKFLACIWIMGHHATVFWEDKYYPIHGGYIFVEFFYMVSGFYFMRFLNENCNSFMDGMQYVKKRFLKFLPYTSILFIVHYIILCVNNGTLKGGVNLLFRVPFELTFITNLHIFGSQDGQLWYIAAMLFVMPFMVWIYNKDKYFYKYILCWAAPLLWYGYCWTTYGQLGHRGVFIDLIRAVTNLLLGCAIYSLSNRYKGCLTKAGKVVCTVVAQGGYILALILTWKFFWMWYDYFVVFLFFVSLLLLLSENSYTFSNRWVDYLGRLSMTMYITHIMIRYIIIQFFNLGRTESYILFYLMTMLSGIVLEFLVKFLLMAIKKYRC